MESGPARRRTTRNMGRGRKKVDGRKGKKPARAVHDTGTFYPIGRTATPEYQAYQRRINRFYSGLLESVFIADRCDPQYLICEPARDFQETVTGWADSVAKPRGMAKAAKGARRGKPASGAGGKVHVGNRASGKQRPESGVVGRGPKKARGGRTRRSGKGRGADRGAAK